MENNLGYKSCNIRRHIVEKYAFKSEGLFVTWWRHTCAPY